MIGFIGQGFIGKSYADFLEESGHAVIRYSLEPAYEKNRDAIRTANTVFIAVPTPTTPEGVSVSIVESVLPLTKEGATVVIKSTVPPGTTELLQAQFPTRTILHAPEFLREAHAAEDVRHPVRNIIGIPTDTPAARREAERILALFPRAPFERIVTAREAELIKYATNCLLYTKVVFVNILYDLALAHRVHWDEIREALKADPRLGPSHFDPVHKSGPLADTIGRGAGGHCFIKDFEAFRRMYAESGDALGQEVLDALVAKNNELLRSSGKDLDILRGVYGA